MVADRIFEGWSKDEAGTVQVRDGVDRFDVRSGYGFEPDGLPDTGGAGVMAGTGMEVRTLFSAGLKAGAHIVLGGDDEVVLSGLQGVGDVERE